MLVPMVVVVAGCLPQPRPDLPASFLRQFTGPDQPSFTVQTPPAGQTGQAVVAALQAEDPTVRLFRLRAVPVFGVVDCHGKQDCETLLWSDRDVRGQARNVWLLLYPDCIQRAGEDEDVGWAMVDALMGPEGGYATNQPCGPQRPS